MIIIINIDDKTQVRAHQRHRRGLHLHHARTLLPLLEVTPIILISDHHHLNYLTWI